MLHERNVVVPWLVALLVTGALAHAQATSVGRLLRTMQVEGCTEAQRDAIALHLGLCDDVVSALAQSLDDAAASVVERRLATIYHEDGFPAAVVTAQAVDGVLRVRVVPGAERRAGPITVRGESPLSHEALVACLGRTGAAGALWRSGESAAVGAEHAARVERAVVAACEADGRHGARVRAAFDTTGDTVRLAITFEESGFEVRIQKVVLTGDDEAHAKHSLESASFTPGMLATTAAIDGLVRHCLETGRYLRIEPLPPEGPVLDPLVLRATMRPGADTMQDVPREDVALLQRFLARLATRTKPASETSARVRALQLGWTSDAFPKGITIRVAGPSALVSTEEFALGGFRAPFAWGSYDEGMFLRIGESSWQWDSARAGRLSCSIRGQLAEDGTAKFAYGFGWSAKEGPVITLDVHPGFIAYSLSKRRVVLRWDDAAVHVDFGPGIAKLQLDREGAVQEFADDSTGSSDASALQSVDMPSYAESLASPSATDGTVRERLVAWLVRSDLDPTIARDLGAMLESLIERGLAAESADDSPKLLRRRFAQSPGLLRHIGTTLTVGAAARGWPVLLGDSLLAIDRRDTRALSAIRDRLQEPAAYGPLAGAILAQVYEMTGLSSWAGPVRVRARARLELSAVLRDLEDLCVGVSFLAALPQRIGASWRALPELRARFAGLPAGEAGDRLAFERGIGLLWEHGGRDLLARWLEDA